jgi:hypothetical protein
MPATFYLSRADVLRVPVALRDKPLENVSDDSTDASNPLLTWLAPPVVLVTVIR